MEEKRKKPTCYDVTRFAVSLPGILLPTKEIRHRKVSGLKLSQLRARSVRTPVASVQEAFKETLGLLRKYQTKINQDVRVVQELLQLNPYFSRFQWVAKAAERLGKCQRAKRKRGRPKWRYTINPEVILGLVWLLRESGEAESNRDAADWLEISGIFSSTRVLRLLKQAKKDARLKPMLAPPPDSWPDYTEEELMRMYETAISPEEGQILKFELQGDHFQYVGVQFPGEQPYADENNS